MSEETKKRVARYMRVNNLESTGKAFEQKQLLDIANEIAKDYDIPKNSQEFADVLRELQFFADDLRRRGPGGPGMPRP